MCIRDRSAVIYNDDGLDVANEKIRQLFIGRYLSFTRGNTLTQMAFTIMGYMVSGYNPNQIAEVPVSYTHLSVFRRKNYVIFTVPAGVR